MDRFSWWVQSGVAEQSARSVAWFVVIVFIGIAFVMWRDVRSESRGSAVKNNKDVRR